MFQTKWVKLTWHKIYNKQRLYQAALKLYTKSIFKWQHSLITSHDDATLYEFAKLGPKNLDKLHKKLSTQNFSFGPALKKQVNFFGKVRSLYIQTWQDKIVDTLLYTHLNKNLDHKFSAASFAYRTDGHHLETCQRQVAKVLDGKALPVYVLKRDIKSYFDSIDHNLLIQKIKTYVDENDYLFQLIVERIAHSFFEEEESSVAQQAKVGVAFGTPLACLFANIFLNELDHELKPLCDRGYFRYSDDFLCMTSNAELAYKIAHVFESRLQELHLTFKDTHKLNLVLGKNEPQDLMFQSADRFKFLGLEFRANGVHGLSKDKLRKIKNRFRFALKARQKTFVRLKSPQKRAELAIDILSKTIDKTIRNVALIDYYLKHTSDVQQLKDLDHWLALEVLAISFQKGHKKGFFKKLPYKDMRKMGLPSLVHRAHLLRHKKIESSFFVWKNYQLEKKAKKKKWLPGGLKTASSSYSKAESNQNKVVGSA